MIFKRRPLLTRLLALVPGKKTFGLYRFMPVFFLSGAALEFSMINWEAGAGKTNFYKSYKRRVVHELALEQLRQEEEEEAGASQK